PDLAGQLPHLGVPAGQVFLQRALLGLQLAYAGLVLDPGLGEGLVEQGRVAADALDLVHHELLNLGGRDGLGRAGIPAPLLRPGAELRGVGGGAVRGGGGGRQGAGGGGAAKAPFEWGPEVVGDGAAAGGAVPPRGLLDPPKNARVYD